MVGVASRASETPQTDASGEAMTSHESHRLMMSRGGEAWTDEYGEIRYSADSDSPEPPIDRVTAKCNECSTRRPHVFLRKKTPGSTYVTQCYGDCRKKTKHSWFSRGFKLANMTVECPDCGYSTVLYKEPKKWPGQCPNCISGPNSVTNLQVLDVVLAVDVGW